MKKLLRMLTSLMLAGALVLTLVPALALDEKEDSSGPETWAFYWYVCGTSFELNHGFATDKILSLLEKDLPDNLQIVMMTGSAPGWDGPGTGAAFNAEYLANHPGTAADELPYVNPTVDTDQIFLIENRKMVEKYRYGEGCEDGPYMNMGDADTVIEFFEKAFEIAPADHIMLSFFDHGGDISGAMWDEHNSDNLTLEELHNAVAAAKELHGGKNIELVDFDACLMATIETAYYLHDVADYMLASEETEICPGQDYKFVYDETLWGAGEAYGTRCPTAVEIAETLVEDYIPVQLGMQGGQNYSSTLSVIDLSKIPGVVTALGEFSTAVLSQVEREIDNADITTYLDFLHAAEQVQIMTHTYMLDLYDFMDMMVEQVDPDGTKGIRDRALEVMDLVGTADEDDPGSSGRYGDVVHGKNGEGTAVIYRATGTRSTSRCMGLTFYYPNSISKESPDFVSSNMKEIYTYMGLEDTYYHLIAGTSIINDLREFSGVIETSTEFRDDGTADYSFTVATPQTDLIKSVEYLTTMDDWVREDGGPVNKNYLLTSEMYTDRSEWIDGTFTHAFNDEYYTIEALDGEPVTLIEIASQVNANQHMVTYRMPGKMKFTDGNEQLTMVELIQLYYEASGAEPMWFFSQIYNWDPEQKVPTSALGQEDLRALKAVYVGLLVLDEDGNYIEVEVNDTPIGDPGDLAKVEKVPMEGGMGRTFQSHFVITDLKNNVFSFKDQAASYITLDGMEDLDIFPINPVLWEGEPIEPMVDLRYHNSSLLGTLAEGMDYKVTYTDNDKPGTATVTVESLNEELLLGGPITATFKICEKDTVIDAFIDSLPGHEFPLECFEQDNFFEFMGHIHQIEAVPYYYWYGAEFSDEQMEYLQQLYGSMNERLNNELSMNGVEISGVIAGTYYSNALKLEAKTSISDLDALSKFASAAGSNKQLVGSFDVSLMQKLGNGTLAEPPQDHNHPMVLKLPLSSTLSQKDLSDLSVYFIPDPDMTDLLADLYKYYTGKELNTDKPVDLTEMWGFQVQGNSRGGETYVSCITPLLGKFAVYAPKSGSDGPSTPVTPIKFTDVESSAYYYDAVNWAVGQGITSGTTANTFSPDAPCTRAQIVSFLWRAAGSPKMSGTNSFVDVSATDYYYDAVLWAVANGITVGSTDTTFSPNSTCTRAQAMTFLYRDKQSPAVSGTGSFTDVPAGEYYADAVQWAVANGVTAGTTSTTFSPDQDCTRAQIMSFLYRDRAN